MRIWIMMNNALSKSKATLAPLLTLANLTVLPAISFFIIVFMFVKRRNNMDDLTRSHFQQSIIFNVFSGLILIGLSLIVIAIGGIHSPYTWVVLIIYFTSVHAGLILLSLFALTRAMAGKPYRYPIIGSLWQFKHDDEVI